MFDWVSFHFFKNIKTTNCQMLQFRDILLNNNNGKPNSRIIKTQQLCLCRNILISLSQRSFLPAGLEKSRTLVAGCSRSGLLDDRLPGMGMMATLWRHCLVPTMLSSWDWPMPPSLERKAAGRRRRTGWRMEWGKVGMVWQDKLCVVKEKKRERERKGEN